MTKLFIDGTEDTPTIDFCFESKLLKISGRSLPEDVTTFFQPALDWLEELHSINHTGGVDVVFNLEYFNTASSKLILDILMKLEEIHQDQNTSISITWEYDSNDSDMKEAAEEYSELVEVPFKFVAI